MKFVGRSAALTLFVALLASCEADPEPPLTDADCKNTYWCDEKGRCKASGADCIATSKADCEASTECKSHNRCLLSGGHCVAPITGNCTDTPLCTKRGYCTEGNDGKCCNTTGWCCTPAGKCGSG